MKKARFFAGKTQAQLALDAGTHYTTISRLERGYVSPSNEQKVRIAEALDVDPVWLFPEEE